MISALPGAKSAQTLPVVVRAVDVVVVFLVLVVFGFGVEDEVVGFLRATLTFSATVAVAFLLVVVTFLLVVVTFLLVVVACSMGQPIAISAS